MRLCPFWICCARRATKRFNCFTWFKGKTNRSGVANNRYAAPSFYESGLLDSQ